MGLSLLAGIYPQVGLAEGRTGRTFLSWSESAQDSFIDISVSMAGIVASQTKPPVARCIDDWYYASGAIRAQRNDDIRQAIAANQSYDPSAVVFALLRRQCGAFS